MWFTFARLQKYVYGWLLPIDNRPLFLLPFMTTKKHPGEGMLYGGGIAVADTFHHTSQLSLELDNAVYAHWFLCKFFDKDVCRMHVFQSKTVGDVVDFCTVTIICKSFC